MAGHRRLFAVILLGLSAACLGRPAAAQEPPYFVTYSHHLEEPGNLEIEFNPVFGTQRAGNSYLAATTEFEYGIKAWWTSEFYLDGQSTFGDSSVFTGFRWENRFRPLMREHWINPLLYLEYEDVNEADKALIEVVGSDNEADYAAPNSELRAGRNHELEGKLALSSDFKGWNVSENFIAERNLGHEPYEFGYAAGASRPLALAASARYCNFCAENFLIGAEFYGGLGDTWNLTTAGSSHYGAAIIAWQLPNGATFHVSPGFGLNANSHRFVLRWGLSYEIPKFGSRVRRLFR
jgi:hypothetical protein